MGNSSASALNAGVGLANASSGISKIVDNLMKNDYDTVNSGISDTIPHRPGAHTVGGYGNCRDNVDWKAVSDKYKGASWTEKNSKGISPQKEVWGICSGTIKQ